MSLVRMLVLGAVKSHGSAHGYVVQRELENWRIETWTKVRPGSIYHALKQLAKERKLMSDGEEKSDEGPSRTIYRLTPEGEAELLDLTRKSLSSFDLESFSAGIALMHILPREEAVRLLRKLQQAALENANQLDALSPNFMDRDEPPHTADLLDVWSASLNVIATQAKRIAARLESGDYIMAGEE